MRDFYAKLAEYTAQGERVAVATVVRTRGSVPREAGTKMLIHPGGRHYGTIGGGCGEGDVINAGLRALDTGRPARVQVDLTDDITLDALGVCGGIMDVFVEPWTPEETRWLEANNFLAQDERTRALLTVVDATGGYGDRLGRRVVLDDTGKLDGTLGLDGLEGDVLAQAGEALERGRSKLVTVNARTDTASVYVEVLARPPRLVIVGAGHIAAPLAQLGKLLDFHVTVIDDRPAFANRARFPAADDIIVDYFRPAVERLALDRQTYLVLVTRGHQHDVDCLQAVLDRPTAYIGMIGSGRRVRAVFDLLEREMGIDKARLDKVYSPIGLDIGAETPAEIAVAIMAEIVKARRGGTGVSLAERERQGPVHSQRYIKS